MNKMILIIISQKEIPLIQLIIKSGTWWLPSVSFLMDIFKDEGNMIIITCVKLSHCREI